MLATAPIGMTQSLLTLYGFHASMVAELVGRGLATMTQEKVRAAGGLVEVVTIRITEAGSGNGPRQCLAEQRRCGRVAEEEAKRWEWLAAAARTELLNLRSKQAVP